MKNLIQYFIKRPIWANVIKILAIGFGLVAVMNLTSSFFPEKESRIINIQAVFPGASPEEVEKGVITKIENNLKGIEGIERYTSKSLENTGSITVDVSSGYDVDDVLQDVKNAVNRINSFPERMEPVTISRAPAVEFAISFSISGDVDLHTLKKIAQNAEEELRSIDGISQIELSGFPAEEIHITVDENALQNYNLTFMQIANAVRAANLDLTAGSIRTQSEELLIRLKSKEYYAGQLSDIVLKADSSGSIIYLSDVADIEDTWEENPRRTYVNDQVSAIIKVNKILGENIIQIAEKTHDYIHKFNKQHEIVKASIVDDSTIPLKERLQTLISTGGQGVLLVLLSLALFLNLRLAFWVALAIPFAFLGTLLMMLLFGFTINAITLFGMIVVVGILVDDGIIISEQIYQYHEKGYKPFNAAYSGALNVLPSVTFAILTTIVAFSSFFFFEGDQGRNMIDMAFVVIVAIIFSLIESALILPSHLAHSRALRKKEKSALREKFDKLLLYPRDNIYNKALHYLLDHRHIVVAGALALTIITFAGFRFGIIKATFFPYLDRESFEIAVELPAGTRAHRVKDILDRIEKAAWEVNEEIKREREDSADVITKILKNVAQGPSGIWGRITQTGSHLGTVKVVLLSAETREMDSYKISNRVKEKVGPVYEAENISWGAGSIFGKPVSIPIISGDLKDLENAREELKSGMKKISALKDISDNSPQGMREIRIRLKKKAYLLGLTEAEVAGQVRRGFFGEEVQRLQRDLDEIKVWVKYSDDYNSKLRNFEEMRIRTPRGGEYPLLELIDYEIDRGIYVINHLDGKREITVEAEMVDQNAEVPPILGRVKDSILAPILEKYPSVTTAESGQQREILKMARSARISLSIALVLMFFLIVLSFRSFSQSVIVISLIPLGLIGAAWGHFLHGMPVNMMSAYGIIALIGIIVNDSIVFVNTFNQNLTEGMDFRSSAYDAAIKRFRPILLTSTTTILGLAPLIASTSRQATFLIPMALSIAYGLLLGSIFILLFLPIYLSFLNDIRRFFRWLWTGEKSSREEVEPAIIEQQRIDRFFEENNNK